MKANEPSPANKENQCLKLCSTAAAFGETVTKHGLTKTEIKTETNISDEDVEVDLDVGSNDSMYNRVSGSSPAKSDNWNQNSVMRTATLKSEEDVEINLDVGSNNGLDDQGSQLHLGQGKDLEQINIKPPSARPHQEETFEGRADREVSWLKKESSSKDVNMRYDHVLVDDEDEDDNYNRFYFESDHLALKDNKQ